MTITAAKTDLKAAIEKSDLLGKDNVHQGLVLVVDDAVRGGFAPPLISLRTIRTSDYDMINKPRTNRAVSMVVEYIMSAGSEYPVGAKLDEVADSEYEKFEQVIYFWCATNNTILHSVREDNYNDESSSGVYKIIIAEISLNADLMVPDSISGRPLEDYEGIEKQKITIKEEE